ncbi:MAG: hypothetical protein QXI43_00030 [Candidatus Nitrosocaldus sp.]
MLTKWLDVILEEPARTIGIAPERLAVQAGGGALAAATNIAFEEFTTTLLNTIGKALIGLGMIAHTSDIIPVPRLVEIDDRTKQEILIIGSAIGLDGIYRAVRNLSATQTATQQFISTLTTGNILGALQMLVKNPFQAVGITGFGGDSGVGVIGARGSVVTTVPANVITVVEEEERWREREGEGGEVSITVGGGTTVPAL